MKIRFTLLLAVLLFASLGFKCGSNVINGSETITYSINRPIAAPDAAHPECLYDESSFHLTPGGVTVRSCVPVPDEALAAIERGIAHQIRNSSHYNPNWTGARSLSEYQVFLIPEMAVNRETDPGSPALLVRYLTQNSSLSDPVQTAGTVIGVDGAMFVVGKGPVADPRYSSEVLPEQSQENWTHLAYLEESSRNESEHKAEWDNNRAMFRTYAIVGDVHPHFPDWSEAESLTNVMKAAHLVKVAIDRSKVPCSPANGVMVCQPAAVIQSVPSSTPTATPAKKRK
jgi:hypothetical protein